MDAVRDAISTTEDCVTCKERTTGIYVLACGCANACKGCLIRQDQLDDNRCPTCRVHRYTIGEGWKEDK